MPSREPVQGCANFRYPPTKVIGNPRDFWSLPGLDDVFVDMQPQFPIDRILSRVGSGCHSVSVVGTRPDR